MDASAALSPSPPPWSMAVRPDQYDCGPLSPAEQAALAVLVEGPAPMNSTQRRKAEAALARLFAPLRAVLVLRRTEASLRPLARRIMCQQMHQRGRAFWHWSAPEWGEIIGATYPAFTQVHALGSAHSGVRPHLLDLAYLLCGFDDFGAVWTATAFYPMARVVFGAAHVDAQIARMDTVLGREGYATGHVSLKQRHQALSLLLLLNRSPWLESLTWAVVERAAAVAFPHTARIIHGKVAAALIALGVLAPRCDPAQKDLFPPGARDGVPDEWYAWYLAWRATGSRGLARRVARGYGIYVLYTGRWLARRHPGIVSPAQWTEDLALALRTAVLEETNDIFVSAHGAEDLRRRGRLGRPFSHETISQFLAAMRRFFRDLQTKAHGVGEAPARRLPRTFDPREALATPTYVEKALAGSEPRDIAPAIWQRLAIQAACLRPEDLPRPYAYWPFAAVQAMALLWVSTARRPNELLRLRIDCIRAQWEPDMCDDEGAPLPPGADIVGDERGAQVYYLHIPSSKYGGPGWIWIPKYTADAITHWQAERGTDRAPLYDHKDREFAALLFTQRGKHMGLTFLNRRLIPLLCARAGVAPRDAEGAYTAHRGRSARISLLHACGLELEDLAAYAIHKDTRTIKKYARRHPIHLHRKIARADTLSTVIEGLYDPDAAQQGQPAVRWFLGYDTDGAPQFCGLPAHHTCPHRMDCPHCGLFIGGEQAQLVHDDPSLLRVTAEVPLTEAQRLLSQGQVAAAERALDALRTLPTPVPPSAAYLTNPVALSDTRLSALADVATEDARTQLTLVEGDLAATLAEYRGKDGRNVAVRALRQRLAFVRSLATRCRAQLGAPEHGPRGAESSAIEEPRP